MSAVAAAVESIAAREILDSRGQPTIEAEAVLRGGARATAAAPAGASTGSREAKEARDGDERRFGGRGVLRAAANIENEIAPALRGMDARAQKKIDAALIELDGVADKSRLGANAVLAVSLAVAKAAAAAEGREFFAHIAAVFAPDFDLDSDSDSAAAASPRLPLPLLNVLNGGAHADNNLRVQEFMLAPAGFDSFAVALRAGVETFHALRRLLAARGLSTAVGDEGGFAPDLPDEESALELLTAAIEAAGYAPGRDIFLAIDCAASEFCENGRYLFRGENLDAAAFAATLQKWRARYPLFSIEDPLDEDDWDGWRALTARMGADAQLIGDDLFATDARALQTGIERGVGNASFAETQSNRHDFRNRRRRRVGQKIRLRLCFVASIGRDRRRFDSRSCGRLRCRPDQSRRALSRRASRQNTTACCESKRALRREGGRASPGAI